MAKTPARPEVRNYIQVHHYLRDIYNYRKSLEPGFSYESWAADMGITSRSHLRLCVIGRRNISDSLTELLVKNLHLSNKDKDYFVLLILHAQSTTPSQKSYYAKKLADFVAVKVEKQPVVPTPELLRDPTVIALRLYLTFDDVSGSEKELSEQLGAPIEEIQQHLTVLALHGLVEQVEHGHWRATSKWIQFTNTPDNTGMRAYHAASLDAAKKSMSLPADTRHFRSLTWAMNAEEYNAFLNDFSEFIEQMNTKYEKNALEDRKLMQLNMNLIPALIFKKAPL